MLFYLLVVFTSYSLLEEKEQREKGEKEEEYLPLRERTHVTMVTMSITKNVGQVVPRSTECVCVCVVYIDIWCDIISFVGTFQIVKITNLLLIVKAENLSWNT